MVKKNIYLSINKLNKITTTNQINYFSKILLNSDPGNNLYDNFIDSEIIYDDNELLDELEELEIKFINDEGKLYNFNKSNIHLYLKLPRLIQILKKMILFNFFPCSPRQIDSCFFLQ